MLGRPYRLDKGQFCADKRGSSIFKTKRPFFDRGLVRVDADRHPCVEQSRVGGKQAALIYDNIKVAGSTTRTQTDRQTE